MPKTAPAYSPPWYSYINIDLLYRVLQRSVFHPFISWIIPLSLLSLGRSVHDPVFIATVVYAALVNLIHLFFLIDGRLAFGGSNPVDLREEVVVITGGSNGLGLTLAQMLGMQGATVAVLDVEESAMEDVRGVTFFRCDISDSKQMEGAIKKIRKECGTPTVLINNAAVVMPKAIFDLTPTEVERIFNVNVLSHFHAIRVLLPDMLSEGHGSIVTISSVMGKVGCANLSYTSTKSALFSMHASLRADLAHLARTNPAASNIKTVLVAPGQLNTRMFATVESPSNFLAPIVEPVELAREIVRHIQEGRSGEITLPLYTRFMGLLDVVPCGVREVLRNLSGMDRAAIEGFQGKERKTTRKLGEKST